MTKRIRNLLLALSACFTVLTPVSAFAQRVYVQSNIPPFEINGYISLDGSNSLTKGDTATGQLEGFIAFPFKESLGAFAKVRAATTNSNGRYFRTMGGIVFAFGDQAQFGFGGGEEFRNRNSSDTCERDTRFTYSNNYCYGSNYGGFDRSADVVMAYIYTHDKNSHFRGSVEVSRLNGYYGYSYSYSTYDSRNSYGSYYEQPDAYYYDAEYMFAMFGTDRNGTSLGAMARRHTGVGPKITLNMDNFVIGAFAGWDAERPQLNPGHSTGADNRMILSVSAMLRL